MVSKLVPRLRFAPAPSPGFFAALIGVVMGLYCYLRLVDRGALAADFTWAWRAARELLLGHDPYIVIQSTGPYPYDAPFYYPLPTAFLSIPLANLAPYLAGALFFGLGAGLLAFGLSRGPVWRLLLFLSPCFWISARLAQWSPLLTAAYVLPGLVPLAILKPNLGLPALLTYANKKTAVLLAVLLGVSLIIVPTWPLEWLKTLRQHGNFIPALTLPFGPFLLLAALGLRNQQARLLLLLALMPQRFYDPLPLWLLASSPHQSLMLSILGWAGYVALLISGGWGSEDAVASIAVVCLYLPALYAQHHDIWMAARDLPHDLRGLSEEIHQRLAVWRSGL